MKKNAFFETRYEAPKLSVVPIRGGNALLVGSGTFTPGVVDNKFDIYYSQRGSEPGNTASQEALGSASGWEGDWE